MDLDYKKQIFYSDHQHQIIFFSFFIAQQYNIYWKYILYSSILTKYVVLDHRNESKGLTYKHYIHMNLKRVNFEKKNHRKEQKSHFIILSILMEKRKSNPFIYFQ